MEKVLLVLSVNHLNTDCVIETSERVVKYENGEPIWHEEEKRIAKAKKYPYSIDLYVKDKDSKHTKINISSQSIKRLYEEIIRIESIDCTTELDC